MRTDSNPSSSNGEITTHVWDGASIALELNANNGVINAFTRDARSNLIRSTQHGFYLFNARGDVMQRVNEQGIVIHAYRYTAFGVEQNPHANNTNPFRFASMYWDNHTQTYMTPNRHFNPRTGRWTQPDPYWGVHNIQSSALAILQSGNLYLYTMNNPVRWIDLTGLFAEPVMLRYIAQRNRGSVTYNEVFLPYTGETVLRSVTVSIGDTTRNYYVSSGVISVFRGRAIIDRSVLMDDFGLAEHQARHLPWDQFSSMESAAIAFALMNTRRATDLNREIGALIYSVTTGMPGNRQTHYTFGTTWVGGERDVVAGLIARILIPERDPNRMASSRIAALAHTHPAGDNIFSTQDMRITTGGYNVLGIGVPTMPVFMSVHMRSGYEVRVFTRDMCQTSQTGGRLIFSWQKNKLLSFS
jgi:RHS repeat-associated protein